MVSRICVDRLPAADALRELVVDLRLLLHADLFQRHVVMDGLAAPRFLIRVLAVLLVERRRVAGFLAAQRVVQLRQRTSPRRA